jgi:hypothetical protein
MAFRGPKKRQENFDDILVIDETRGLAVLDDVVIQSAGTSSKNITSTIQQKSVLEEQGSFCYEVKFFINTEHCSRLGIKKVAINTYDDPPPIPYKSLISSIADPNSQNSNILSRKFRRSNDLNEPVQPNSLERRLSTAIANNTNSVVAALTPLDIQGGESPTVATHQYSFADTAKAYATLTKSLISSDIIDLCLRPSPKIAFSSHSANDSSKQNVAAAVGLESIESSPTSAGDDQGFVKNNTGVLDKNKKGSTTQTYKVLISSASKNDSKNSAKSKFSFKRFANQSNFNGSINRLLQSVGTQNNYNFSKEMSVNESQFMNCCTELVTEHSVHPANVLETFYPTQFRTDSVVERLPSANTKVEHRKSKKILRQSPFNVLNAASTQKNITNIISILSKTIPLDANKDFSKSNGSLKMLTERLCKLTTSNQSLDTTSNTTFLGEFKTKFLEVNKEIRINIDKSLPVKTLFFEVVLITEDENDKTALRKIFDVNHEIQLREFTTPEIKPTLKLEKQQRGTNILSLSQNDPFATSIIIEKRIISPHKSTPEKYQFYSQIPITCRDKTATLEVKDSNTMPDICAYRAISIGPFGQRGHNFDSILVKGMPRPVALRQGVSGKKDFQRVSNSLFAKNSTDGIRLTLSEFPPNALGFYIVKTELGTQFAIDGKLATLTLSGEDEQMRFLDGQKTPVAILDRNVYDGRSYRYHCVFKLPNAKKVIGNSTAIIKFLRPIRQLPVDVNLKDLKVTENNQTTSYETHSGDNLVISFEIETIPTETGIEEITQLLTDANVDSVFIDDLRKDRNRLSSFAFYEVSRVNLKTGKKESFGITTSGRFEDNPEVRKRKDLSPIEPGDKFEYIVDLYLKSPESLFKGAVTQLADSSSTSLKNDQYSSKTLAQKFALMYVKSNSLPSEQDLLDKTPGSLRKQISRGATGFSKSIDAIALKGEVGITELSVKRSQLGYNEITWKLLGDKNLIEFCTIYATTTGKTQPIGIVLPNSAGQNQFFDKRFCNLITNVTYTVEIVKIDFSRVKNTSSVSIERKQSMPQELITLLAGNLSNIETKNNSNAKELESGTDSKSFAFPRSN